MRQFHLYHKTVADMPNAILNVRLFIPEFSTDADHHAVQLHPRLTD